MFDDPFMYGGRPGLLNWVHEEWLHRRDIGPLRTQMAKGICFKEVPANFGDDFNLAIIEAAAAFGYRHVHLERLNVFAQLASRGVAEQLDAWSREETAAKAPHVLKPLPVDDLVAKHRLGEERWAFIERRLNGYHTVYSEEISSTEFPARRRRAIAELVAFLDLPSDRPL